MSNPEKVTEFTNEIEKSLAEQNFSKLSLGNYRGAEENLKNIYLKRVLIKQEEKLSFTYRYKTRDITKNFSFPEALEILRNVIGTDFQAATLQTTSFDLQL